jgi:hypothetical protein
MTLEQGNDDIAEPSNKSYGVWNKRRIKKENKYKRKRALEDKQKLVGNLTDEEKGRLKELKDDFD